MAVTLWTRERIESQIQMNERDSLAFLRLQRMINQSRPLILSDGKECLLVQEGPDEPIWIWTSDGISDESLADVIFTLSALKEEGRLKAVVAKNGVGKLISMAFEKEVEKRQRILVYVLGSLSPFKAKGFCVGGNEVDPVTAGEMIAMLAEGDGEQLSPAVKNSMGNLFSHSADSFAWKTEEGEIATIAKIVRIGDRYTDIHSVITKPELRNRGYAKAMLTEVCSRILAEGRIPMLYADRDYPASNAVYRAIGFTEKRRLTTLRFHE